MPELTYRGLDREYLGGSELRGRGERDLGHAKYVSDQMYPAYHIVVIFDAAARAGLYISHIGEVQIAVLKRAQPWYFTGTLAQAMRAYEANHRKETTSAASAPSWIPGRDARGSTAWGNPTGASSSPGCSPAFPKPTE